MTKPYFFSEQWGVAWGLLILLVALMLLNTAAGILVVDQTGEFTTALANRDSARYWRPIYYTIGLIIVGVPIYGLYYYVRDRLTVHWRSWMTKFFMDRYFENRAFYRLSYLPNIDNPDQRIAEDINSFTSRSIYFLLILIETGLQSFAYSGLLWYISQTLVVFLVIYATIGTLVTWLVFGRPLEGLNFFKLRKEAGFRFGLVRVRENAESVAFYNGEPLEQPILLNRLDDVVLNSASSHSGKYKASFDVSSAQQKHPSDRTGAKRHRYASMKSNDSGRISADVGPMVSVGRLSLQTDRGFGQLATR